jgi:hypothetical protein
MSICPPYTRVLTLSVDDDGEQVTGACTALRSLLRGKIHTFPSGEVFPLIARGLLTNCPFVGGTFNGYFPALIYHETHILFFSEKILLGFQGALFYCFRAKSLWSHGTSLLFFLLCTCGSCSAEVRAHNCLTSYLLLPPL